MSAPPAPCPPEVADPIPIAIVGAGKIAREQHLPTIAADPRFRLAAAVTRTHAVAGVPNFDGIAAMIAAVPDIRAVSLCTPPRGRLDTVREALERGLDVMLEKPPAATLTEAEAIVALAAATPHTLFLTWHSREAAAVEPARRWLAGRTVRCVAIRWREDVRHFHPGQDWIWEPSIGVFDPGINALSILTRLLPGSLLLERAALDVPANRQAPIAAALTLRTTDGAPIEVVFDIDHRAPPIWDIVVDTDAGRLHLSQGGARMTVDGAAVPTGDAREYPRLYARFAALIGARRTDADLSPLQIVADAALLGERHRVAAFEWDG